MANGGGEGSANIGAVEVGVVADIQTALDQVTALEGRLNALARGIVIPVAVEENAGGAKRRRSRSAASPAEASAPVTAPQPAVAVKLDNEFGNQLKTAIVEAFATGASQLKTAIEESFRVALAELRQGGFAAQAPMPSASGETEHSGPPTYGVALTPQRQFEVYRAQIAGLKASQDQIQVYRNFSSEFKSFIGQVANSIEDMPERFGGAEIGHGSEADMAKRVVNLLVPGLRSVPASQLPKHEVGGNSQIDLEAAANMVGNPAASRSAVVGLLGLIGAHKAGQPGMEAFFDKENGASAPPTPAVAPVVHNVVATPPPVAEAPIPATLTEHAPSVTAKQVKAEVEAAVQGAVATEDFDFSKFKGFAPSGGTGGGPGRRTGRGANKDLVGGKFRSVDSEAAPPNVVGAAPVRGSIVAGRAPGEGGPAFMPKVMPAPVRPAQDVAADLERYIALGLDRQSGGNSRRGSSSRTGNPGSPRGFGAIEAPGLGTINIDGVLRAIESGFGGAAVRFGEVMQGKRKGDLVRLTPNGSPEDFDERIRSAGKSTFTTAGGLRVRSIDAGEVLRRTLLAQYGSDPNAGEHVDKLLNDESSPLGLLKKLAIARGSKPLSAARGVSQLASDPSREAPSLTRFMELSGEIEALTRGRRPISHAVAPLPPSGNQMGTIRYVGKREPGTYERTAEPNIIPAAKPGERTFAGPAIDYGKTPKFGETRKGGQSELALDRLGNETGPTEVSPPRLGPKRRARLDAAIRERNALIDRGVSYEGPISPEAARAWQAAAKMRAEENRSAVAGGVGLSPMERSERALNTPTMEPNDNGGLSLVQRSPASQELLERISEGHLPDVFSAVTRARERFNSPSFEYQPRYDAGGTMRPERNTEALYRLLSEEVEKFGLEVGPKGDLKDKDKLMGRKDLGSVNDLFKSAVSAQLGDLFTHNQFAETALDVSTRGRGGSTRFKKAGEDLLPGQFVDEDKIVRNADESKARVFVPGRRVLTGAEEQEKFRAEGGMGPGGEAAPEPKFARANEQVRQQLNDVLRPPSYASAGGNGNGRTPEAGELSPMGSSAGAVNVNVVSSIPLRIESMSGGAGSSGGGLPPAPPASSGGEEAEAPKPRNMGGRIRIYNGPKEGESNYIHLSRPMRTARTDQDRELERQQKAQYRIQRVPNEYISPQQKAAERLAKAGVTSEDVADRARARIARITSAPSDTLINARVDEMLARQRMQPRSLGTALVSIAESMNPRRRQALGAQIRMSERSATLGQLEGFGGELERGQAETIERRQELRSQMGAHRQRGEAIPPTLLKDYQDARETYKGTTKAIDELKKSVVGVGADMTELSKDATGFGSVLSNLAVGAVGGVGGFALMAGVSQVAQGVFKVGADAIGPAIEHAFGDPNTTARIGQGLAQVLNQSGGNVGAIAANVAPTGLSAQAFNMISAQLQNRAQTTAGNQNLVSQVDLMRAAANITNANGGLGGFDQGLFRTTGGIFGSMLGGTPSTAEVLNNELAALPKGAIGAALNGSTTQDLLKAAGAISVPAANLGPNGAPRVIGGKGFSMAIGANGQPIQPSGPIVDPSKVAEAASALKDFNDSAEKAGSSLRLAYDSTGQFSAQVKAASDNAKKFGLTDLANTIKSKGLYIQGGNGQDDLARFLQAANTGARTPSPQLVLEGMQRSIQATFQTETLQLKNQLTNIIPSQIGMQQAFSPIGNLAAPLAAMGASVPGGLTSALSGISAQTASGVSTAEGFVGDKLGSDQAKAFSDALKQAAGYGSEISNLNIGAQVAQAAYQASQWQYQLFLANRNLSDAEGLTGKITKNEQNNLGALQRQNFELSVQAQNLGFAMSQRQINFQTAVAGFTAPGLTGEERAARIQEAKVEAEYAQKQLNLQKQIAGVQRQSFQVQASRSLTDAVKSLSLLGQGINTQKAVAAAQAEAQAISVLQQKSIQTATAIFNTAEQRANDIIGLEGQIAEATGKLIATVASDVLKQVQTAINTITNELNGMGAMSQQPYQAVSPQSSPNEHATYGMHASGLLGMTNGPTNLGVAGEAGGEAVAIIRNPRPLSASPMGTGQAPVVINITGNTIGSKDDVDYLLAELERRLGRRASMFGLRLP